MNEKLSRYSLLLLLAVLVFVFLAGDGPRIIQYSPRSIHMFRQSDCFAYTKHYFQHKNSFFEPAAYNLIGKQGRVVSEFPVLYYLSARLCDVFGFHFAILRGVTFFSCLLGLVYLFLIVRMYVKDVLLSLFPVALLASTPVYFYYAVNFLPNVPAISFSIAGLYHLLLYRRTTRFRHIAVAALYWTLAVVLKPTDGGLLWVAGCAALIGVKEEAGQKWWRTRPFLMSALFVTTCFVAWFLFVRYYNGVNGNQINLQGLYPIWEMDFDDAMITFYYNIYQQWWDSYQHTAIIVMAVLFLVVFIVKWKSLDVFLRRLTLLLIVGCLLYTPLWFKAFRHHDYYQLIFVLPSVFLCVTLVAYYERHLLPKAGKSVRILVSLVLVGILLLSIFHNQDVQLERYSDVNRGYPNTNIYEVEPYLRKIGVAATDPILSLPDNTPNVTLAAYGNYGWTSDLFSQNTYGPEYCIAKGAKYMIVADSARLRDTMYSKYARDLVGKYKDIYVYRLRKSQIH